MSTPSSLLTSAGLIGGFAVARATKHRHWGGVVAAGAGLGAMEACRRRTGVAPALALGATYAAALTGSHPLAKKIGAWPSVLAVTGATAVAAHLLAKRRG
ncbi:hypothetical protein [Saccharopolyspora sp. ASAGF58]|uniref:hypothetical protein n=1 Tax=Saccharopolyspora TaxID=1835 RepID=UPI00144015A4|nr:hypothetical protein [Saccharopolyspora sp. ASAGF58]QIZ36709.1 hypothetical protein FDZ84_21215 [Saccharopolyspora sp. ASAGF58]